MFNKHIYWVIMFLDRIEEIEKLKAKFKEKNGALIILYGRRRIGKSELLQRVIGNNDVYFLSDLREKTLQLNSLRMQLSQKFKGFESISIPDWDSFFNVLHSFARRKFTLVLDEFPYLVKNAPELPSIIQKHIDLKHLNNINLVLCGSSQSMMTNLFDNSKAPLYGRANMIFKLDYLPIYFLRELLNITPAKTIEEFAVWGGVPRYWIERAKYGTLDNAIMNLVMNKYGLFYDEPIILFLDEMRTSMQSNSILSLIAGGSNKISEIAGRLGKPATHLSRQFQILLELGYLKKEIPFGESEKNSKKSLYKIKDPFLRFYFSYVVPNRSIIELGMTEIIKNKLRESRQQYTSSTYEDICREAVPKLFMRKGTFLPGKRYWTKDFEVDIISKDLNSNTYIVGEIKWSNKLKINSILSGLDKKINSIEFLKGSSVIKVIFGKNELKTKDAHYFSPAEVIESLKL